MKKILIFILLMTAGRNFSFAQPASYKLSSFDLYADTLKKLGDIILKANSDSARSDANASFNKFLHAALIEKNSFTFGFDSVKNMSKQIAPDKTFCIYTWMLPKADGTDYTYFGIVQTYDEKKNEANLFDLVDSSKTIINPQSKKLNAGNWYGCLYYQQIVKVKKKGKSYYTLFGWHGKDRMSTRKLIDIIYFIQGKPMFGYPVFKTEKTYSTRVIFEFTAQAVMSLRYERSKHMIVFDHLSLSKNKELHDSFQLSGPDGTYDAFEFKNERWNFLKDIDMRTDWKSKPLPKEPQIHEVPVEK